MGSLRNEINEYQLNVSGNKNNWKQKMLMEKMRLRVERGWKGEGGINERYAADYS